MRAWTPFILFSGVVCLASTPTIATSLQVSPVIFEMPAGKAADTLTVHNDGITVLDAQVRVYRWSQADGLEKMEPTGDVVASPPIISVAAGADQIVRLVRVSKKPVVGEENYRVIVDELPDKSQAKSGQITFTFKHSIPMFFTTETGAKSNVTWVLEKHGGTTFIAARNDGNRRVRIGGLTLTAAGGKDFVLGKGLNGYVLSGSSMRWALPNTVSFGSTGPVTITARSDEGPIHATAQAQGSARR